MSRITNIVAFYAVLAAFVLIVAYPTSDFFMNNSNSYLFTLLVIFRLVLFFIVFHILGYWFYRLLARSNNNSTLPNKVAKDELPNVAVLIPIKDEPIYLVNRMFFSLKKIQYPRLSLFAIDNSTTSQVELFNEIARDINLPISVIRKDTTSGFKAGALNKALKGLESNIEYVLILDIDHAPKPEVLQELVPELSKDRSVAFIQAPQTYENNSCSIIEGAYCYRQRIFYDHICPGLSFNETLFFSGTNALFRKKALDEIGGFDESSLTEDLRTSVKLHQRRWIGRYYNKSLTHGIAPTDLQTYHRQQRRWAIGTYQNFFFVLRSLFRKPFSLTLAQQMLYLGWNGMHYFQGVSSLLLVFCSVIFLFFDVHHHLMWTDALVFPIFLITIFSTMLHERKAVGVPWEKLLVYKALMFGDSVIHINALIDYVFSRQLFFEVTSKTSGSDIIRVSSSFVIYHVFLASFLGLAILASFFVNTFNAMNMVWPLIFLFQAITILAATRFWMAEIVYYDS